MKLFDKDILLTDLGNARFGGVVSDNWSVNGNPNGGYLMAMIADAMLRKSDKKIPPLLPPIIFPVVFPVKWKSGFQKLPVPGSLPVLKHEYPSKGRKKLEPWAHSR